jgi:hypothetical protein
MSIVKGRSISDLVVKVGVRSRWSPSTGASIVETYKCLTKDAADAFFSSYVGGQASVEKDTEGPPYLVTISTPESASGDPNDDYVDVWTMPDAQQHKSLFEFPRFQDIDDAVITKLRAYASSKTTEDYDVAYQAAASGTNPDELYLLELLRKGTDSYLANGATVRWTRTVGSSYDNSTFAQDGLRKIWTATQLKNLNPPQLIKGVIDISTASVDAPSANYVTGWLKTAAEVQQRGENRFDITQEWKLENWSTILYPTY